MRPAGRACAQIQFLLVSGAQPCASTCCLVAARTQASLFAKSQLFHLDSVVRRRASKLNPAQRRRTRAPEVAALDRVAWRARARPLERSAQEEEEEA